MPSLAQLYAAPLDGADWLQVLSSQAPLIHALDAFLAQACAAQSKRLDLQALPSEELTDFEEDSRVVFALYTRLLLLLDAAPVKAAMLGAMRATLLHVTRLVPFCQIYGLRSPQRVRVLLEATLSHGESSHAELARLAGVYTTHFEQIHEATSKNKRGQVVDLIQSVYEAVLSIRGLSLSAEVLELMFGESEDDTLAAGSLVRALAVCYEADISVLQRSLSKLDDKAQKKVALLIPETRRVMLQILDCVFQTAAEREKAASGTGESVLTIIHELSHSTDADTTDHGSFISDLWHLCGYEAKFLEFFDDIKLDRDSVSYLEVILDGLPRRRILAETVQTEPNRSLARSPVEDPTSTSDSAAPKPLLSSETAGVSTSAAIDSLVAQVQDLFPDLGDGYVALCLLSSQNQLETVINYLLESNPPLSVGGVRQDLKRSDSEYSGLERKVLGLEPLLAVEPPRKSEKVDPSRIWVGKRAQEKSYDPQVARNDPSVVEKVKQIADEYAIEENYREAARHLATSSDGAAYGSNDALGGMVLDEYDDDYNDEFEDYEPFSVHDGGQAEDFDAIRRQNRRLRELEAEDAFWEGMRNQNRRGPDLREAEDEDGENDDDESKQESTQWARGPARGEWKPRGGATGSNGSRPSGEAGRTRDEAPALPMTEQQQQRQRQRDNKNKAKVGNHHRKDRALKKRG